MTKRCSERSPCVGMSASRDLTVEQMMDMFYPNRIPNTPILADFGPAWRKIQADRERAYRESLRRYPLPPGTLTPEAQSPCVGCANRRRGALGPHGPISVLDSPMPVCNWKPNMWQPVFWGIQDLEPHFEFSPVSKQKIISGPPSAIRVVYPSLQVLGDFYQDPSGKYPVVLFAHGRCYFNGEIHHLWAETLKHFACAGYVLVVPYLGPLQAGSIGLAEVDEAFYLLDGCVAWLQDHWEHASAVDWSTVGMAGHLEGALVGAIAATSGEQSDIGPVTAFGSLNGSFDFDVAESYFSSLNDVSCLFMSGTAEERTYSKDWRDQHLEPPNVDGVDESNSPSLQGECDTDQQVLGLRHWGSVSSSYKHGVQFPWGFAYDYLADYLQDSDPSLQASMVCKSPPYVSIFKKGFAQHQWMFARDVLITFFTRYMPPSPIENVLPDVPDSLFPPSYQDILHFQESLDFQGEPGCQDYMESFVKKAGLVFEYMMGSTTFPHDFAVNGPEKGSDLNFSQFAKFPATGIAQMAWEVPERQEPPFGGIGLIQIGPGASGCGGADWSNPYYDCSGDGGWGTIPYGYAPVFDPTSKIPRLLLADWFDVGVAYAMPGLIIVRDAGGFFAMSSICTHMGCDLALAEEFTKSPKIALSTITCACHKSVFGRDGTPFSGPDQLGPACAPNAQIIQPALPHYAIYVDKATHRIGVNTTIPWEKSDRFPWPP